MDTVIVTTNLGHFKAFRLLKTPEWGYKLELLDELEFPEAHARYADRYTDSAGRRASGSTVHAPPFEPRAAEQETARRLVKLAARQIQAVLEREQPEGWHFAARDEVRQSILDALEPAMRERVVKVAPVDLTKSPVQDVLSHFVPR